MKVLVTGGSNGIGKATSQRLIEKDHEVTVFDKEEPDYEVDFYQGDVRDENRVKEVVESVEFEVLVNCAGFYELGSIEDMERETIDKIFNTNVHGYLNFIRHSMPMLRQKNGRIVNISSVAGRVSMPFYGAYCGSKHAVESISHSLRRESEVEVVLVEPGVIKTGFNERARKALEKYLPDSHYANEYEEILDNEVLESIGAEKVGEKVARAVTTGRPKRRYQVPLRAKFITWISFLPQRVKDRIFEKVG
ncbi:MAG: SDR family NAD(P)-dependent oxidoreductase [Nanohaloarchaea archaeon]|nr:SDR family NAD(P)-dependent oxidoreductase [Candidatus Nanohaloarchaea archaeon]